MKGEAEQDPRVYLAAERTLLAWVRTGLSAMGFGFVVARFGLFLRELAAAQHLPPTRSHGFSTWVGTALVLLGVLINVAAAWRHAVTIARLEGGEPWRPAPVLPSAIALGLGLLGLALAGYLIVISR